MILQENIARAGADHDAVLASAAERLRAAAADLPGGSPPSWRGAASTAYTERLGALRDAVSALAPEVEGARRLLLVDAGRGGILG